MLVKIQRQSYYKSMKKLLIIIAACLLGLTLISFSQAQENAQTQLMTASGKVASLDWVGSLLAVDAGGDTITFVVDNKAKVTKGTNEMTLAEINQSDNVTVQYYDGGFKGLIAVTISVNNP